MGAVTWDPNYTPGMNFLDHIFSILKNSGQDLSNEESNFILRLSILEVGQWAAQTQAFFDKLPDITDFGLLQGIS